jgi:hypothetical protein
VESREERKNNKGKNTFLVLIIQKKRAFKKYFLALTSAITCRALKEEKKVNADENICVSVLKAGKKFMQKSSLSDNKVTQT